MIALIVAIGNAFTVGVNLPDLVNGESTLGVWMIPVNSLIAVVLTVQFLQRD